MDIERTKQFYRELKQSDLCGCAYCRNYVKEAAKAYPAVTAYLQTLGAATVKDANDVEVRLAQSHPDDDIQEPHFVIEIFPIFLPWTVEETKAKQ